MKTVHLQTIRLITYTLVIPAGAVGTHGTHDGELWSGVPVTHERSRDHAFVMRYWNEVNPTLRAVSVDAPVIRGQ